MEKRGLVRAGAVAVMLAFTCFLLFSSVLTSAIVQKQSYELGEKVKLDLKHISDFKLKINTPSTSYFIKGSNEELIFEADELGTYILELSYSGKQEVYEFSVGSSQEENAEYIDLEEITEEPVEEIHEEVNSSIKEAPPESISESLDNEDLEDLEEEVEEPQKIRVGETVNTVIVRNITDLEERIEIPALAEDISINSLEDGKDIPVKIEENTLGNAIKGLLSIKEVALNKDLVLENQSGEVEISYQTPAPEKEELKISENKKEVTVSSQSGLHYENVTSFTDISEITSEKSHIKVYWKEEEKYLDFDVFDKDGDGLIDYIEWEIPHLSTQNFEIIVITSAQHLDQQRTFVRDIYEEVKALDNIWVSIPEYEYVRVQFEKNLTSENDITLFARSNATNARIEVYEKNSTVKIAEFSQISTEKSYKTFLSGLVGEQDTFDLIIFGGEVEFDFIVDPATITDFLETFPNTDSSWTGSDDGDTSQDEWWNITQESGDETSISVSTNLNKQGSPEFGDPPSPSSFLRWNECDPNNFNGCFAEARDSGGNYWNPQGNNWTNGNISFYWAYYVDNNEGFRFQVWNGSSSAWITAFENISDAGNTFVDWTFTEFDLPSWVLEENEFAFRFIADSPGGQDIVLLDNVTMEITLNSSDITPPAITIHSPLPQTYPSSQVDFNISTDEPASSCVYSINGAANVSMTAINTTFFGAITSGLRETTHDVLFSCADTLLNRNSTNTSFSVDVAAPDFKVHRGQGNISSASSLSPGINISDTTKAFVTFGKRTSQSGPDDRQITAEITTNSSLTLERVSSSGEVIVDWEIIESDDFYVQRGEQAYGASTDSISIDINSINTSSSFALVSNRLSSGTNSDNVEGIWKVTINDSTTIVLTRGNTGSAGTLSWQVVEWNGSNVQSGEVVSGDADLSASDSLASEVNVNASFLIFSYNISGSTATALSEINLQGQLVDGTNINFSREGADGAFAASWFVIENSKLNVQRNVSTISGSTAQNVSFLEVNTTNAFSIKSKDSSGNGNTHANADLSHRIANSSAIEFEKGTGSQTQDAAWFIIEFFGNRAPTHAAPILNSTTGANATSENLTVYPQSQFDPDGDSIKNIISWYRNGDPITILNMPFEGALATNTTHAKDYSGTSNNGTVSGAIHLPTGGYDGQGAFEFNGSSNITISDTPSLSGGAGKELTVMAWVNPNQVGGSANNPVPIVTKYLDTSNKDWALGIANSQVYFGTEAGGNNWDSNAGLQGSTAITAGNWVHLAFTLNGRNITLYLNGQEENSTILTFDTPDTAKDVEIGSDGYKLDYFNGTIDDVFIFNKSLTPDQISAIYNNETDTIVSRETFVGETWQACLTPNDGSLDGIERCSNDLDVVGEQLNVAPLANQTLYTQGHSALVTINTSASGSPESGVNVTTQIIEGISEHVWWNSSWNYRIPVNFSTGNYNRTDTALVYEINFTDILNNQLGLSAVELDSNSIRVLEYTNATNEHTLIPSQFDSSSSYDALTNAQGEVVWIMTGETPADTLKEYYIYFDTNDSAKSAPSYSNLLESDAGTFREINWTVNNETFIRVNVEETSDGTQSDRESFISLFEIGGFDFTTTIQGMDGIAFVDTVDGGSQFDLDLLYNSTPISGPVHARVILDAVPDGGGSAVGQVYLDFYPTRYFRLTTLSKSFGVTSVGWINPNSANRAAYEDSSSGITIITSDTAFTSEGQWVANDVNDNLTIMVWNLTDPAQQTNDSQVNFDAGGTDFPSWDGDADDTELDMYFGILNTTDFNESANFAGSLLEHLLVGGQGQRLALENISVTDSNGEESFIFDTTGQHVNNYSIVSLAEKENFLDGINFTNFEILEPLSPLAPVINLTSPANNTFHNSSTISLFYNVTDLNDNLKNATLILNGQRNATNETALINGDINNFTIDLPDGVYNWTVNASDTTHLEGTNESLRIFTIDTQAPSFSLHNPLADESLIVSNVFFNFTVTDNLDGSLVCDLIIDSVVFEDDFSATSGIPVNFTEPLSAGLHWWNVTCIDNANNLGISETRNFTITDEPPRVSLETANNTFSNTSSILLQYNATDNNGFFESFLVLNGQANETNQTEIINHDINNFSLTGLLEGVYTWNVNVTDTAGLNATNETSRIFTIDLNAPNITINYPANNTQSNLSTVDFNFSVVDTIDTDLSCTLYLEDVVDGPFSAPNGTSTTRTLASLTDGPKLWNITCIDDASNEGISELRLVNITEPPAVQLNTSNNSFFNTSTFNLAYIPTDNTGFNSCSLYIDNVFNQTNASAITNGAENTFTVEGASSGSHTWFVSCNDTINLQNQSEERTFTVDTNGLSIDLYAPEPELQIFSDTVLFQYNVTDDIDPLIECGITVNSVEVDLFNATSAANTSRSVLFSEGGLKIWNVTCTDDALNTLTSETRNFTLAFAPVVTLTNPPINTHQNNPNITLFYEVTDDNDNLKNATLILNGQRNATNATQVINQEENNITVTLPDGIYNWTVNVSDTTHLESTDLTERNFTIDTTPSVITLNIPTNNSTVTWNNFTFNFTVTDNLDAILACDLYLNGSLETELNVTNGGEGIYNTIKGDGLYLWNVTCTDDSTNVGVSEIFNFTMDAPPNVTLGLPANNSFENTTTTLFHYTPLDPIDISNCSLIVDDEINQTETLVTNGIENIFTVQGLSQGQHNWTVSCTDVDNNAFQPVEKFFTTDSIAPVINLNLPANNTNTLRQVDFNFTVTDNLDDVLVCNLTTDSTVNVSNIQAINGSETIQPVSTFTLGSHTWSVDCYDNSSLLTTSATFDFNVTLADLEINTGNITADNLNPTENETVIVNATIHNLENVTTTNVTVQFYEGDPALGGTQLGENQTIVSIEPLGQQTLSVNWTSDIGTSPIFVLIDPTGSLEEWNETNNNASNELFVSAWHTVYGDINSQSEFDLAETDNNSVIRWSAANFEDGNIYVTDSESIISWVDLRAIGKDTSDADVFNDLDDVDLGLGMENFTDSVNETYGNSSGYIDNRTDLTVFTSIIQEVPVANSTNNTNFITGILWDASDDTNSQYDTTEKEDLVFVTRLNKDKLGAYGTYDYELRIPAKLREYIATDTQRTVFYTELR